jgi:hypothetical protein
VTTPVKMGAIFLGSMIVALKLTLSPALSDFWGVVAGAVAFLALFLAAGLLVEKFFGD